MISKQYRFIQLHIPRTGGSSVQDALWRYRDSNTGVHPQSHDDFHGKYDWHLNGFTKNALNESVESDNGVQHVGQDFYSYVTKHLSEDSKPASMGYGREKFDEYFVFTFVRNPWDRFVSLWVKFKEEVRLQENFNKLYGLNVDHDFKEMEEVLRYLWLSHKRGLALPRWFKPQYEFVHAKDLKILVNFVGRYENFQNHFDFLCERIDYPQTTLPNSDKKERRQEKEKAHYIQYYDKATADVIAEIYKDDLETWNYEFGD